MCGMISVTQVPVLNHTFSWIFFPFCILKIVSLHSLQLQLPLMRQLHLRKVIEPGSKKYGPLSLPVGQCGQKHMGMLEAVVKDFP